MSDLFGQTRAIKALSLWQPWATLVARGAKARETRHWQTSYRGPLAIHAAKTLDMAGAPERLCQALLGPRWWEACLRGAVVAIGELRGCVRTETLEGRLNHAEYAAGNYAPGRFAWTLANVRPLVEPIPTIGRQGLFDWAPPDDVAERLGPVVDQAATAAMIGWAAAGRLLDGVTHDGFPG